MINTIMISLRAILLVAIIVGDDCSPTTEARHKGRRERLWQHETVRRNENRDTPEPWQTELQYWLKDFEIGLDTEGNMIVDDYELMQADAPRYEDTSLLEVAEFNSQNRNCPHEQSSSENCDVVQCSVASDCTEPAFTCCFNGCVKTCMLAEQQAPLIDWAVQPRPKRPGSLSWLLDGPEENGLLDVPEENGNRFQNGGMCVFHRRVLAEGETITYETHTCQCINGDITCMISSTDTDTN